MLKKISKKGMLWSDLVRWVIIGLLIIVVLLAIVGPSRRVLFDQLDKLINLIKFGK